MKSDLHHLFPTDVTANSQRGSYPFGVVSNPLWQNGGSKLGSNIFEPASGNDTLLEPGEALCLQINLNTSNNYPVNEFLIYTTDINGPTADSIPVISDNGIGILGENTNNLQIKLYPNPVTDYCIIAFNKETLLENCKVNIVDENGKKIKSSVKLIGNNKLYIETKSLSKGVYFVIISNFVIEGTSNVADNCTIKLLK